MERITLSRASLVDVYISGLNLTAIVVVASADGRRCRIHTGEPAPGETVKHRFYFKASHAELVLLTIAQDGWTDQQPAVVAALIERTAATLGAPYSTPEQLRKAAGLQVDEIVERVKSSGQRGKLKHWNAQYKQYRLAQVAKAEKAIPYSSFLEQVVITPTVRDVAMSGRMI